MSRSLGLQPLALGGKVVLIGLRRKSLAHVGVSLVLPVDQMVGRCDVVVPVCFKAPNRVLAFKAIVVKEPLQQIFRVRHRLKPWEKARLSGLGGHFLVCIPHVRMISNLANSDASLWISVQDLRNEVLAVR